MMNIQDLFIYFYFYLDKLFVNIIFAKKKKKSVKLRN